MSFLDKISNAILGSDKLKVKRNMDNGGSKDADCSIHSSSNEGSKNEQDTSSLQSAVDSAQGKVDSAQGKVDSAQGKVDSAQGKVDSAQSALDGIGSRPESKTTTNPDGTTTTDDSAGKAWDAKKAVLEANLATAQAELQAAQAEKEEAQAEKEAAQAEKEDAQTALDAAEEKNQEIQDALEKATGENEDSQDLEREVWLNKPDDSSDPTQPKEPRFPNEPTAPIAPPEPQDPFDPTIPIHPTQPKEPRFPNEPTAPINPPEPQDPFDRTIPIHPINPADPTNPVDPLGKSGKTVSPYLNPDIYNSANSSKVEDVKEIEKYGFTEADMEGKEVYVTYTQEGQTVLEFRDETGKTVKGYCFNEMVSNDNPNTIAVESGGYLSYTEFSFDESGIPEKAIQYQAETDSEGNIVSGGPKDYENKKELGYVHPNEWNAIAPKHDIANPMNSADPTKLIDQSVINKILYPDGVEEKVEDTKVLEAYGISDADVKDKDVYRSTDKDGNTVIQLKDANGNVTKAYVFKENRPIHNTIRDGSPYEPDGNLLVSESPEDETGYTTYIEYTFNADGEPETAVEYAAQTDKDGKIIYGGPSSENKTSTNNTIDPASWADHKPLTAAEAANIEPDTTYPIRNTGFANQFLPDGTKVEDIDPNDPELTELRSGEVAINNTVFEKLREKFEIDPETGNFKFDAEHSYEEFKAMVAVEKQKATEEYIKEHPEYAEVKEKADKAIEEHDNYMKEQMEQYSDLSFEEQTEKRKELEKEYRETHKDYVGYLAQKTPDLSRFPIKANLDDSIPEPKVWPEVPDEITRDYTPEPEVLPEEPEEPEEIIRDTKNPEEIINDINGSLDETVDIDAFRKAAEMDDNQDIKRIKPE